MKLFIKAICLVASLYAAGSAQAQAPIITSFARNGTLICSNLVPGSPVSVEWASSVGGPWNTNWDGLISQTVGAGGVFTSSVPMFYRVRGYGKTPPTITTLSASGVSANSATLNGSGNPNLQSSTGWFRYSTSNPGTPNDVFGTRSPTSSGAALGAGGSPVAFSQGINGLLPNTTYYYCAIGQNVEGTSFGAIQSFTTTANSPTVATVGTSGRTGTSATLNGSVNAGGANTVAWFRYSTTSPGVANDTFGTRLPANGGSAIGSGNSLVPFSQPATGLSPGTTYYYCAIATNSAGTGFGSLSTFTTPLPPAATTTAASAISGTTATLNGTGNPNGATTTGWFRYSTINPGVANDTAGIRAPASGGSALGAGSSAVAYSQTITGLVSGTTYYFWSVTSSAEGTGFGTIQSFTTASAPAATTAAASSITSSTATLNGTGDPNLASATGWFRYSTVNPGVASDSFGTRAPASSASDTALGSGTTPVAYSNSITALLPGTTYYYCAIVTNSEGIGFGSIQTFTTAPAAPTVSTGGVTGKTSTGATLNATANPGGTNTVGWFRYSTTSPGVANDTFGTRTPAAGSITIGTGNSSLSFTQAVTGLTPNTTYFYCAIATNIQGKVIGALQNFTTLP